MFITKPLSLLKACRFAPLPAGCVPVQMPTVAALPDEEGDIDPSLREQLPLAFGAAEKKPHQKLKEVFASTRFAALGSQAVP